MSTIFGLELTKSTPTGLHWEAKTSNLAVHWASSQNRLVCLRSSSLRQAEPNGKCAGFGFAGKNWIPKGRDAKSERAEMQIACSLLLTYHTELATSNFTIDITPTINIVKSRS